MDNNLPLNPWMERDTMVNGIESKIDQEAIELVSKNIKNCAADTKRRLKGIYFDSDVADKLDDLKKNRVNVSGLVNDAVRYWIERKI